MSFFHNFWKIWNRTNSEYSVSSEYSEMKMKMRNLEINSKYNIMVKFQAKITVKNASN